MTAGALGLVEDLGPEQGVLRRFFSSPLVHYSGRRVLQAVPVVWGVTFLTFCLLNLLPGTTAAAILGGGATKAEIHSLTVRLGLNKPVLVRYWHWLTAVLHGHLGSSLVTGQPISTLLAQRLPVSLEVVVVAFIMSVAGAVPVALLAARKPRGIADRISIVVSMFGLACPNFVFGLILILVLAVHAGIFPSVGFVAITSNLWQNIRDVILPAATIGFGLFCSYSRLLRADMIDQYIGEEYIVTAKAKGLRPREVLLRHALPNSLFGMVTLIGLNLGTLIAGTVIVEQIFALPGMGQELLQAINDRDVPVVEAIVLLTSCAVVFANLVTDLVYCIIDPRVRYGSASRD